MQKYSESTSTISDNGSEKEKLSVISEESQLIYSENLSNLSNTENIFPSGHNIETFSANSIDKDDKISEYDLKIDDLTDSDESLGILPDLLENLTDWDSLHIDLEKSNDLSSMSSLSSKDVQNIIMGSQKISAEIESDNMVINSTCIMPSVSFSYDEVDSPIQTEKFPKFTSTPKHEINFSDVDEDSSISAFNLSPEFFQGKSAPENAKEKEYWTTFGDKVNLERNSLASPNIKFSNVYVSEYEKNERNNLLNITLTYPAEMSKESSDLCEEQSEIIPSLPESEENNIVDILNTTYEKRDKSPPKKPNENFLDSKNSNKDIKENMPLHYNVNESYDTAKISSFQTSSLSKKEENKLKFESKTRKSIAILQENKSKSKADKTQVRRNSFVDCASNLPKKNSCEPKVAKASQIFRSSLKYPVTHVSHKSSVSSPEKFPTNNDDKNVYGDLFLKTEDSVSNVEEVKPVSKVSSQECLLNKTINISPDTVSVEKTELKEPRNSLNLFSRTGSRKSASEAYERNIKLGRNFSACYQSQSQVSKNITEATAVFQKTLKKPSTSAAVPKRDKGIPRLSVPTFYQEKSNITSAAATERKCIPSIIGSHSAIPKSHKHRASGYSSKSTNFEIKSCLPKGAVNLNETVLISDTQTIQKQFTAANKPAVDCPSIRTDRMDKKYEGDDKIDLNDTVILSDHKSTHRQTFEAVAGPSQIHHPLMPTDRMDQRCMKGGAMSLKTVKQSDNKIPQISEATASTSSIPSLRPQSRRSRLPQAVKSSVVPKKKQIFKKKKFEGNSK